MRTEIIEISVEHTVYLRDKATRKNVEKNLFSKVPVEIRVYDNLDDVPVAMRVNFSGDNNSPVEIRWNGETFFRENPSKAGHDWKTILSDPGTSPFCQRSRYTGKVLEDIAEYRFRLKGYAATECERRDTRARNEAEQMAVIGGTLFAGVTEPVWVVEKHSKCIKPTYYQPGNGEFFRADRLQDAIDHSGDESFKVAGSIAIDIEDSLRARPANASLMQASRSVLFTFGKDLQKMPTDAIQAWAALRDALQGTEGDILSADFVDACEAFSHLIPLARLDVEFGAKRLDELGAAMKRRAAEAAVHADMAIEGIDFLPESAARPR